jgi:CBS-domain-containing membrane protein
VQGMVTASDLLARVAGTDHTMPRGHRMTAHHANALKRHGLTAEELMTAPAITVQPETSIVAAARLAARSRVRSLPVVDGDGTLLGIVTRDDLVKVFVRPDDEIEAELRREVIDPLAPLPGQHVEVQVSNGVATLAGRVATALAARSLEHQARTVPGVVEVQSEIDYEFDDSYLPVRW